MPPPPPPQQTRINLSDLKSQIAKKVGPERAQRYFYYLNRLLAQKLSKPEFNKLCLLILGRENIALHNQLIRSILKNAFQAKTPPSLAVGKGTLKPVISVGKKSPQGDDGFNQSLARTPTPTIWSNGDILPPSPRKVRSGIRDRRIKDRPSPLGLNGRSDATAYQSLVLPNKAVARENGLLGPCDFKGQVRHHQCGPEEEQAKRLRAENLSPHDRASVQGKVVEVEYGEEVEQIDDFISKRGPLQAPLGIPFCHASVGGARKSLLTSTSTDSFSGSYDSGELCHTEALRKRMEKIAELQGMGAVTMDCANLLNHGLDSYLKRLIGSCFELVRARSGHEQIKHLVHKKQQPQEKLINGVWPGNHMHLRRSGGSSEGIHELKSLYPISLQDFRVAMELNPKQLGEDWPLLLEKICHCSFEE